MRIESLVLQQDFSCSSNPLAISSRKQSLDEWPKAAINVMKLSSTRNEDFFLDLNEGANRFDCEKQDKRLLLERLKIAETAVQFMQTALSVNKKEMVDMSTQTDNSIFDFDINDRVGDVTGLKRKRSDEFQQESCWSTMGMKEIQLDEFSMCSSARWTRDEHARFLQGLERFGVGQWCRISRFCLPSRTPAQIASHHQKFVLRSSVPRERRGKESLLDMTTPTVERLLAAKACGEGRSPFLWGHMCAPLQADFGVYGGCTSLLPVTAFPV